MGKMQGNSRARVEIKFPLEMIKWMWPNQIGDKKRTCEKP